MFHKFIARRVRAVMASRPPDFVIGPPGDPYMLRWWWIPRNRFFNIYIHRILHDDEDRALHDHPWASLSYMVEGVLFEFYTTRRDRASLPYAHWARGKKIAAGQWTYRSPGFAHRLVVLGELTTTIFITGPRVREWGFHCPKGWVPWRDFVARDNKGAVGRGCGEIEE